MDRAIAWFWTIGSIKKFLSFWTVGLLSFKSCPVVEAPLWSCFNTIEIAYRVVRVSQDHCPEVVVPRKESTQLRDWPSNRHSSLFTGLRRILKPAPYKVDTRWVDAIDRQGWFLSYFFWCFSDAPALTSITRNRYPWAFSRQSLDLDYLSVSFLNKIYNIEITVKKQRWWHNTRFRILTSHTENQQQWWLTQFLIHSVGASELQGQALTRKKGQLKGIEATTDQGAKSRQSPVMSNEERNGYILKIRSLIPCFNNNKHKIQRRKFMQLI